MGWKVEHIGSDRSELVSSLNGTAHLFLSGGTMVVLETTGKLDLPLIQQFFDDPPEDLSLLIYSPGQIKKKSPLATLAKKHSKYHKEFTAPKPWKADEVAADFAVNEAKDLGVSLDPRLAQDLVRRIGTDFGHISFEVQKYAFLALSEGSDSIEPTHVKRLMAMLSDASAFMLAEALENRSRRDTLFAIQKIHSTQPNSLIEVLRRTSSPIFDWLRAANMMERGMSPNQAAEHLGVNTWRYKNHLLPAAGRWKTDGLKRLIKIFAETERSVLNGSLDPWVGFETGLLRLFDS